MPGLREFGEGGALALDGFHHFGKGEELQTCWVSHKDVLDACARSTPGPKAGAEPRGVAGTQGTCHSVSPGAGR